MNAEPIFIAARPKPKPYVPPTWTPTQRHSPGVTSYVYKDGKMVPLPVMGVEQSPERPKKQIVFCPNCASVMNTEALGGSMFQSSCCACGLSGPRKSTSDMAISAVVRFFKD